MPAWVVFAALVILPVVGAPIGPLWLLAGGLWGKTAGIGLGCVAAALTLATSYGLSRGVLRPLIEAAAGRFFRWQVPRAKPSEFISLTVLLRVTPGVPFPVQNYLLSLAGVPFPIYMGLSLPIIVFFMTAFMVLGDSIFEGRWGGIVVGLLLMGTAAIAVRMVHRRLKNRAPAVVAAEAASPGAGEPPSDD